jgi:hypothetical protein
MNPREACEGSNLYDFAGASQTEQPPKKRGFVLTQVNRWDGSARWRFKRETKRRIHGRMARLKKR